MGSKSFPNALALIVLFVLASGLFTYIIPSGQYERKLQEDTGQETVIPGSYEVIEKTPLPITRLLMAFPEGVIDAGEVIVLILLLGGCFFVIEQTGVMTVGINLLVNTMQGREKWTLVVVGVLFAAAGALNGFQEEVIALTPVLLLLGRRMGYNATAMVSISFGTAIVAGSVTPINPFAILLAQKIAEVPLMSGSLFRVVVLIVVVVSWIYMTIRYSDKNRIQVEKQKTAEGRTSAGIESRHWVILILIPLAFVVMVYGIMQHGWGFNEISAEFLVLGVLSGLVGGLGMNGTAGAYTNGFKEMIFACMVVGFARGISIVLTEGQVIDSIIYGLFTPMQFLAPGISAIGMMLSHALLHFPLPSYSAQAALTLPILAPLSDLIGLSRQVCLLAYQYGAPMMDVVVPTNGALMAILVIAGIPYNQWWAFIWKRMLVIMAICALAILTADFIGL